MDRAVGPVGELHVGQVAHRERRGGQLGRGDGLLAGGAERDIEHAGVGRAGVD
ncbi:MAG: hypothetical protein WDO13_02815 [Verrucomicrobiota bacterium]